MNSQLLAAYGPGPAAEYWLRLEQVIKPSEVATIAETAELIDELYGFDPCDDPEDLTGGRAVPTDIDGHPIPPIDEEKYWQTVNDILNVVPCPDTGCRTEQLKVYRSHPEPYLLVLDNGRIVTTVASSESVSRSLAVAAGNAIDVGAVPTSPVFTWNSAANPDGSAAVPPEVTVSGRELQFGSPVTGLMQANYSTSFDLVTIEIPNTEEGEPGECNVTAFYHAAAYDLAITSQEPDPKLTFSVAQAMCEGSGGGSIIVRPFTATCYELVSHVYRCRCSNTRSASHSYEEEIDTACPDNINRDGRFMLGRRTVEAGYVDCGEWDATLTDPEYYEAVCCDPPPWPLPTCRKIYSNYGGVQGIEGGVEMWQSLYGPHTRFEPVGPRDGVCGRQVIEQDVRRASCCADVQQLTIDWAKTTPEIGFGDSADLSLVLDPERLPARWQILTAGYYFAGTATTIIEDGGPHQVVVAMAATCGDLRVKVDDGCSQVTFHIPLADELQVPPYFPDGDLVLAPGQSASAELQNGVPPYLWQWNENVFHAAAVVGNTFYFTLKDDFCGTTAVAVTDGCGSQASLSIRSTVGQWVPHTEMIQENGPCWFPATNGTLEPIPLQPYHAYVYAGEWRMEVYEYIGDSLPGPCDTIVDPRSGCPQGNWAGEPSLQETTCPELNPHPYWEFRWERPCCVWYHNSVPDYHASSSHKLLDLWRWECPDGQN